MTQLVKTWKPCSQLIDFSKPASEQVQVGQRATKYNHRYLRGKPNVGSIVKVSQKSFLIEWSDGKQQRCMLRQIKGNRGFEACYYFPYWFHEIKLEVEVEVQAG